jgi:hypothetical protein
MSLKIASKNEQAKKIEAITMCTKEFQSLKLAKIKQLTLAL